MLSKCLGNVWLLPQALSLLILRDSSVPQTQLCLAVTQSDKSMIWTLGFKKTLLYLGRNFYGGFVVWILESTGYSQNNKTGPKLDFGQYDLIGQLHSLTSITLPHLRLTPKTPQACDPSSHFLFMPALDNGLISPIAYRFIREDGIYKIISLFHCKHPKLIGTFLV